MMIEGNSEIKIVFPAVVASSLWEKPVLLEEQAMKWTIARVYVYSDSVLCLVTTARSRRCDERRWNDQVSTLEDVSYLQRIARIRMEIRLTSSGRSSQEPKHWMFSHKSQADLQGKEHHT